MLNFYPELPHMIVISIGGEPGNEMGRIWKVIQMVASLPGPTQLPVVYLTEILVNYN